LSLLPSSFKETLELLTPVGAVASFIWGIWVWRDKSEKELVQARIEEKRLADEAERLAESRRIEATKPFLERQLTLYVEASQVAAKIATSTDVNEVTEAKQRFWELFWGELALVENKAVEAAMMDLRDAIRDGEPREELEQRSLALAHTCRISLDESWGINAWTNDANVARRRRSNTRT